MARDVAGLSVAADSLSAVKYGRMKVIRDATGLAVDYEADGDHPEFGVPFPPRDTPIPEPAMTETVRQCFRGHGVSAH
ncbi:hypothetical protein OHB33_35240 [Streptomyces sp. NBC_01558]|nr:hypothetical protein OHB33_35240 [Streptomyces sp. NBC_01558]